MSKFFFSILKLPLSRRDMLKRSLTSRDRRFASASTIFKYSSSFSFGIVPSSIPSTNPVIDVIGVLNSCETFDTNDERIFSRFSILVAILFIFSQSELNSSFVPHSTLKSNLPFENSVTVLSISLIGSVILCDII